VALWKILNLISDRKNSLELEQLAWPVRKSNFPSFNAFSSYVKKKSAMQHKERQMMMMMKIASQLKV